jgi:hypothetical protein
MQDEYVRHIEQPQQLFTDGFVDFDKDRGLFRTFANPFESSYEDEPSLQLELIDLHCSHEFGSKFKEGDLLNLCVFLNTSTRICGRRQLFVQACPEALIFVNRLCHW